MFKLFIAAIAVAEAACPQTRVAIRAPMSAPSQSSSTRQGIEAARPLLGYVSQGSNVLYSLVGSSTSPAWGEPVSFSEDTSQQAFLPPRQEYALLLSNVGLSVARLSRSTLYPGPLLADAIARPDRIAFSPSGSAAVLVSNSERRMQTIIHRYGKTSVLWSRSLSNPEELLNFTVSDDGELVVAMFANHPALYSQRGSDWQPIAANFAPGAWTFLPGSHDLILSDRSQNAIVLLPRVEGASITARVLLFDGGNADLIAANKQGTRVLAARNGTSTLWQIDLGSGTAQQLTSRTSVNTLTLLRDGETFLVSAREVPEVLNLSGDGAQFRATGVR